MINKIIYQTINLKLFTTKSKLTVLTTDAGFFATPSDNNIGKIIQVIKIVDEDGNTTYEPIHEVVVQHFPGGYSWIWKFNGKGYSRE